MTVDEQRKEALSDAMHRLKYTVIPNLESVIAGTPTGPVREALTHANIILQVTYEKRDDPNNVTVNDIFNAMP